jgi:hypothetical protein
VNKKRAINLKHKIEARVPDPPYVTGGPAFPANPSDANAEIVGTGGYGVSILDYFAAHVISGLAARDNLPLDDLKLDGPGTAYSIAAEMVDLRSRLPIEPTPVPVAPPQESGPPLVMPPDSLSPAEQQHKTIVKLG